MNIDINTKSWVASGREFDLGCDFSTDTHNYETLSGSIELVKSQDFLYDELMFFYYIENEKVTHKFSCTDAIRMLKLNQL